MEKSMKAKAPLKSQPPEPQRQDGRPGKKTAHAGGAGAQSGATGRQGKSSPR